MKNALVTQCLGYIDATIIAKYVLIFWTKNPSALHDDFWSQLISMWIFGFSLLLNYTKFYLTSNMPLNYYTCSNQNFSIDSQLPRSKIGYFEITSFILNLSIMFRINISQKKNSVNVQNTNCLSKKKQFLLQLEKQSILDLTTASLSILTFILNALLVTKINYLNAEEINHYPNYLYMYFLQLIEPSLISCIISMLYYFRHPPLKESMFRELKNNFPFHK